MVTPLEKLLDKARGSVYKTVILASKRALEIAEGQPSLIQAAAAVKPSTLALREIAQGKCHVKK
jgi:DNA-directed RNA polymerase omega subunit